MAEVDAHSEPAPADLNEMNNIRVKQEEITMKDEHWRAIRRIIDSLYMYRDAE